MLVQELLGFEVRITSAGKDTHGAWRAGANDDLVLAVALVFWWGEHMAGRRWLRLLERGWCSIRRISQSDDVLAGRVCGGAGRRWED